MRGETPPNESYEGAPGCYAAPAGPWEETSELPGEAQGTRRREKFLAEAAPSPLVDDVCRCTSNAGAQGNNSWLPQEAKKRLFHRVSLLD